MRAREERLQLGLSSSCCRVPVSNVPGTRHLSPSRVKGNIMVTTGWHDQSDRDLSIYYIDVDRFIDIGLDM